MFFPHPPEDIYIYSVYLLKQESDKYTRTRRNLEVGFVVHHFYFGCRTVTFLIAVVFDFGFRVFLV